MKKITKLGINNAVLAATIFISGAMAPVVMFGLIIYTLLFEKDEFTVLSAKRATIIYIFFSMLYAVIHIFDYIIRIFMTNLGNYNTAFNKITYLLNLAQLLCFLIMAVRAFLTQDAQPGTLDNKVEEVLNSMSASNQDGVYCSNCGHKMPNNSHFCEKCGTKME